MLLDIVNNSKILGDIITSITRPATELGLVLYVIIITVVIYAQFGLEYFEDWFHFDSMVSEPLFSAHVTGKRNGACFSRWVKSKLQ